MENLKFQHSHPNSDYSVRGFRSNKPSKHPSNNKLQDASGVHPAVPHSCSNHASLCTTPYDSSSDGNAGILPRSLKELEEKARAFQGQVVDCWILDTQVKRWVKRGKSVPGLGCECKQRPESEKGVRQSVGRDWWATQSVPTSSLTKASHVNNVAGELWLPCLCT